MFVLVVYVPAVRQTTSPGTTRSFATISSSGDAGDAPVPPPTGETKIVQYGEADLGAVAGAEARIAHDAAAPAEPELLRTLTLNVWLPGLSPE
jgi:hypothetical protein